MGVSVVYITASDVEEARKVGRELISKRLAACVNIFGGMEAMFHWQGKVESASEAVVVAKTQTSLVGALTEAVKSVHSYDCPCVVSFEVSSGNHEFIDWIVAETD